jgi:hypothetical protein
MTSANTPESAKPYVLTVDGGRLDVSRQPAPDGEEVGLAACELVVTIGSMIKADPKLLEAAMGLLQGGFELREPYEELVKMPQASVYMLDGEGVAREMLKFVRNHGEVPLAAQIPDGLHKDIVEELGVQGPDFIGSHNSAEFLGYLASIAPPQ